MSHHNDLPATRVGCLLMLASAALVIGTIWAAIDWVVGR